MQRREILKQTGGAVTVGLLAGCLGQGGTAPGGQAPDDGSDDSEDETTTAKPTLKKRSFKILDAKCGNEVNEAAVKFQQEKQNVVVTGTINGSDTCEKPVLAGAKVAKSGDLTVTVKTKTEDSATACSQCITELEYRSTLAFDGSLPKSVTVVHESLGETKTATTAEQGAATTTTTTDDA